MSWTTPSTAVAGSVLTAAWLNTYSRDNMNVLKTSINNDGTLKPTAPVTTTVTGTQNDFTPAGLNLSVPAWTLSCNNATLLTITGLAAGVDGAIGYIESVGAGQVDLANQAAGSLAANRFINQVTGTISLAPGVGRVSVQYSATASRWLVIAHEQGAWITPATPTFSGNGSMTWTSVTVNTNVFLLRGRTLSIAFDFTGTVGGTPSTKLQFTMPNGYLASTPSQSSVYNGNLTVPAFSNAGVGSNLVGLFKDLTATGIFSAGTWRAIGQITFEIG